MANDYANGNGEITFEILEQIGVLATYSTGWSKEINFVSWNGSAGKYDIRDWDPSHERMSKGITLKENEMRTLLEVMKRRHHGNFNRETETAAGNNHDTAEFATVDREDFCGSVQNN